MRVRINGEYAELYKWDYGHFKNMRIDKLQEELRDGMNALECLEDGKKKYRNPKHGDIQIDGGLRLTPKDTVYAAVRVLVLQDIEDDIVKVKSNISNTGRAIAEWKGEDD